MHSFFSISKTSALWAGPIFCSSLLLFSSFLRAAYSEDGEDFPIDQVKLKQLLAEADMAERNFQWEKVCEIYESILRVDRTLPQVRAKYVHSARRLWQVRRRRDASFRMDILGLDYGHSVELYNSIVESLMKNSLDAKNVQYAALLHKGAEELNFALTDPAFLARHLPSEAHVEVAEFRDVLQKRWGTATPEDQMQLVQKVRGLALHAMAKLQMKPAVVVMELAAGACYAFDDYTAYLTPSQFRDMHDSLRGDYVGIGLNLMSQDGKIVIADLAHATPAREVNPPLERGDQIVSINKKSVANLSLEAAMELLEGPAGSMVELEIISPTMGLRSIRLPRRILASVSFKMRTDTIGYLQITCFQETTLQEVDGALMSLNKNNMKALVLDLRGNSGGLFDVAVEVARRFLSQGVVVSVQNSREPTVLHARTSGAVGIPLVVLVDGDTASSAEVLAGALKDNKRAHLMGEVTFGKGCTQSIFRLPTSANGVATGGLRITVSRFFSPDRVPYSSRGVVPHFLIGRSFESSMMMEQHLLDEAILEAQRLLMRY